MSSVRSVGVDVIEVDRIARAMARQRFLERCFTPDERAYAGTGREAARRLAVRFCAKEAAFKALDLRGGVGRYREVEVLKSEGGAVGLAMSGRALRRFEALGGSAVHLSVSHGRDIAVAVVVLEG